MTIGAAQAQDTIRSLIITEARLGHPATSYAELTNMGDSALHLSQFEFGVIGPWTQPYQADPNFFFRLPNQMLDPGKSIVICMVYDWQPEMWKKYPDVYNKRITKDEMWDLADIQLNAPESPYHAVSDSVTPYYHVMDVYSGRDCWYIEQHFANGDSAIVDQVNGLFTESDGTSEDASHDVAGVTAATNNSILIRKFSVKKGSTDFETARGIDISDSDWMPVPMLFDNWEPDRRAFWTVGNHVDVQLNETTLTSSTIDINWTDNILTVPWGVRNKDSLMMQFDYQPGLAWHYTMAPTTADSAFISVSEGDMLTVYACGSELQTRNSSINL